MPYDWMRRDFFSIFGRVLKSDHRFWPIFPLRAFAIFSAIFWMHFSGKLIEISGWIQRHSLSPKIFFKIPPISLHDSYRTDATTVWNFAFLAISRKQAKGSNGFFAFYTISTAYPIKKFPLITKITSTRRKTEHFSWQMWKTIYFEYLEHYIVFVK